MMHFGDTIAAIATAAGAASVGIVRVSGPEALTVADRLIGARHKSTNNRSGHTLFRATLHDHLTGEPIDDALVAVFQAPRSQTGEPVIEFQCHGGTVTVQRVFTACLAAGARAARPGEFSERAFTNGKMDLAQAEAIADLVSAGTIAAQRAALAQVEGGLSRKVRECSKPLQHALALIEASIDFPEDVGEIASEAVEACLVAARQGLDALLATAGRGRLLHDGMRVVLAGRPNAGKSSLLNALAGADRAIVTPHPGTTRDIVEEALHFQGIPVRALDTAGIRDTVDPVEQIGVQRARDAVAAADVVVVVIDAAVDAARGFAADDRALIDQTGGGVSDRACVVALNKCDLISDTRARVEMISLETGRVVVPIVAARGDGIEALIEAVVQSMGARPPDNEPTALVTSARHEDALRRASASIARARATVKEALPGELIAVDVHAALQALGEITGGTARDTIIAEIFSRFCIGK